MSLRAFTAKGHKVVLRVEVHAFQHSDGFAQREVTRVVVGIGIYLTTRHILLFATAERNLHGPVLGIPFIVDGLLFRAFTVVLAEGTPLHCQRTCACRIERIFIFDSLIYARLQLLHSDILVRALLLIFSLIQLVADFHPFVLPVRRESKLTHLHGTSILFVSHQFIHQQSFLDGGGIAVVVILVRCPSVFSGLVFADIFRVVESIETIVYLPHQIAPAVVCISLINVALPVVVLFIIALPGQVAFRLHATAVYHGGLLPALIYVITGAFGALPIAVEHVLLAVGIVCIQRPGTVLLLVLHHRGDVAILIILVNLTACVARDAVQQRQFCGWLHCLYLPQRDIALSRHRHRLQQEGRCQSKKGKEMFHIKCFFS